MGRTAELVELIQRRVEHADYAVGGLPAERELAAQTRVSRKTARKAIQTLIDRGLLDRSENGRVVVRHARAGDLGQLALLKPAVAGMPVMAQALLRLANESSARVRPVEFVHWDDPVIGETLAAFGGVFVLPPAEPIPQSVLAELRSTDAAVVVLNRDLSDADLRSVDTCPPQSVSVLLDHLRALGHRRIDCLNTQPRDEITQARIDAWVRWRVAHGIDGELHDQPVRSYENPTPAAYRLVDSLLADGPSALGTAVLCTTAPAAVAGMRRFTEAGLRVGREVSVAAIDDEGLNRFLSPSLACLMPPDPTPYVRRCLDWMLDGGRPAKWEGPLLLRPDSVELFTGESIGSPHPSTPAGSLAKP